MTSTPPLAIFLHDMTKGEGNYGVLSDQEKLIA